MNKKIYFLINCLATLFITNLSLAQTYGGGSGTESDPYLISTASHITELSTNTNNNVSTSGVYFRMTNDIALSSSAFTPIGKSMEIQFSGNFDGNGYSISNLRLQNISDDIFYGLFGCVSENGKISNLTIESSASVIVNMVGAGIAGANYGTIENCVNNAPIIVTQCYSGGIVGANAGTVKNCTNYGSINASGSNGFGAGGIAGTNYGTIECCANYGSITANLVNAGGISGDTDSGRILNCYNRGSVTAGSQVGGIVGMINDELGGATTIKNCYNASTVQGTSSGAIIGIIMTYSFECEALYFDNSISNLPAIGYNNGLSFDEAAMAKTTAELQSQDFIDNYLGTGDGEGVWMRDNNNVNDGYPIFNDGSTTNIDESFVANLNVYPNPATDYFSIEGEDIQEVSIYNAAGEIIRTINAQISDIQNINISEQNSGIYFVSIKTKTANVIKQIVKIW